MNLVLKAPSTAKLNMTNIVALQCSTFENEWQKSELKVHTMTGSRVGEALEKINLRHREDKFVGIRPTIVTFCTKSSSPRADRLPKPNLKASTIRCCSKCSEVVS